ncbi:hypothetical protein CDAR_617631 [Caerostris darwini]|uniref:Cytochrome c biogenesis B n=1 Tax=Caerostris darwini TaxID=1538125 RepID=A0AAV4VQK9_9ARAC|nr:hypothetical protein CDAR_617631 [Caerostris darwini]
MCFLPDDAQSPFLPSPAVQPIFYVSEKCIGQEFVFAWYPRLSLFFWEHQKYLVYKIPVGTPKNMITRFFIAASVSLQALQTLCSPYLQQLVGCSWMVWGF